MPQTMGPFTPLSLPILALPGLLRYYRLDETSGTTAIDSSPSGSNGTYAGGVTRGQPSLVYDLDRAALFDGATGTVSLSTTNLPTGNAAWTLGAWITLSAFPGVFGVVVGFGGALANADALLYISSAGVPVVDTDTGPSAAGTPLALNAPHFVVGTWDGTRARLYVDGQLISTSAPGGPLVVGSSYARLGAWKAVAAQFFPGVIDEAFICNTALAANDIANLYAWGRAGLGGAVIEPGRSFAITIDRAAQAIQVHNDTPYRLYFQLDGPQPTATDSLLGGYVGMAAPWSHPVIPVQRTAASGYERSLNAIKDFQGTLWVMPIDPTTSLAQTGTISGIAEIHVDVYLPGERWPESWAIPRQYDLTSQPRVIALPPPGGQCVNGQWLPGTFPTFQITTLFLSTKLTVALQGYLYLYHLSLFPKLPSGTVPIETDFFLQFVPQNAANVDLDVSTTIFIGQVGAYRDPTNHHLELTPCIIQPHFPLAIPFGVPAGTVQFKIQLQTTSVAPGDCWYNVTVGVDQNNLIVPPGYGGADTGIAKWGGVNTALTGLW